MPKVNEENIAKYHELMKLHRAIHGGMTLEESEEYIRTGRFPSWVKEIGQCKRPKDTGKMEMRKK